MKYSLLILAVASSLALFSSAVPVITNVHNTALSIERVSPIVRMPGSDSFLVTVSRVDDLFDDNKVVAERIQSVQLAFDVSDDQLRCNGQVLPTGGVVVKTITVRIAKTLSLPADNVQLEHHFEKGLAKVEFSINSKQIHLAGKSIRRLTVSERIMEINSETVEQHQATQVMIDIRPDGSFEQYPPKPFMILSLIKNNEVPAQDVPMDIKPPLDSGIPSEPFKPTAAFDYINEHLNHLPPHILGVVLGAMVALASALLAMAVHFANRMLVHRKKDAVRPVGYHKIDEKPFQFDAGIQTSTSTPTSTSTSTSTSKKLAEL